VTVLIRRFVSGGGRMAEPPDSFEALLAQEESVAMPRRGDLLRGVVLSIDTQGAIVDLGLKRDGVIPRVDLDKVPPGGEGPQVGDKVAVMVVDPLDDDGNLGAAALSVSTPSSAPFALPATTAGNLTNTSYATTEMGRHLASASAADAQSVVASADRAFSPTKGVSTTTTSGQQRLIIVTSSSYIKHKRSPIEERRGLRAPQSTRAISSPSLSTTP